MKLFPALLILFVSCTGTEPKNILTKGVDGSSQIRKLPNNENWEYHSVKPDFYPDTSFVAACESRSLDNGSVVPSGLTINCAADSTLLYFTFQKNILKKGGGNRVMTISFDGEQDVVYPVEVDSDANRDYLSVTDSIQSLIQKLKTSKKITIETEANILGTIHVTFDVAGLIWNH